MAGRLDGKRVAVIGAGSVGPGWGNGKAAAALFAREGGKVLCVDRNGDAAEETASLIRAEGNIAFAHAADATNPEAVRATIDAAERHLGGLDVLHVNIGISKAGGIEATSLDDWKAVFAVNLDAAFQLVQAALPLLEEGGGSIVFVSSLAAVQSGPYAYVGYEVSKAALCRLSRSIAMEYAARGVRCNTVLPGMIDTPHVQAFIAGGVAPEELAARRAAQVPMKRQGSAFDIAEAALFLASDAAGFITGVDLRVDGGMGLLAATSS
ncbi:SDR family NAD(P)-dependent oxidoreductase [Rhodobium gokarnense]|uniref:NAD(P)-dependent dehydrogenase (Short-subunit alcohol dehydrogenase family) n=1 Tax=Rhodobium gokarnense TaxID=364296 RepID=A0ABT3HF58_9HYPH|nr:SDR family NAD(P)-dependent oxidoreductase [Rhodobium gokarnense]MCW2309036.1 NAD(P)-dependent dehydrogenase (short-subunit alcohol dehydrogenase family) [Rhodobium gokarnense]